MGAGYARGLRHRWFSRFEIEEPRPQLQACLAHLREGDTLHVHSMDRLARNLDDLRKLVDWLTARGVSVRFHKEQLTFSPVRDGDDTAQASMARLMLSIMGAVAEFERSMIKERQREGIAIAKAAGKFKGRKPALTPEQAAEVRAKAAQGAKRTALAKEYGISRETLYAYLGAGRASGRRIKGAHKERERPGPEVAPPVTMSSREMADLSLTSEGYIQNWIHPQHKHVLYDIRNMLEALDKHSAEFSAQYKDTTGRALPVFNLPKDLTITLVYAYAAACPVAAQVTPAPYWVRDMPGAFATAGVPALKAKHPTPVTFAEISAKALPAPEVTHPVTMSSLEISELTGKQHTNVIRDIRGMLKALKDDSDLSHVHELKDSRDYTLLFELPKDLTITLVSGYSVQMRHRIVTRWLELEEVHKPALSAAPRTLSEALKLAALY